jgi:hypothetical protein
MAQMAGMVASPLGLEAGLTLCQATAKTGAGPKAGVA